MADSVYGSAFYASTGLHGLIIVPIKNNNIKYKLYCRKFSGKKMRFIIFFIE
jgi:hypothetical protein